MSAVWQLCKIVEITEELFKTQSLCFDMSYHFLLCTMPGLRNRSEFEDCLWHTHCLSYTIQDLHHSPIVQNLRNRRKIRQSPKPSMRGAWAEEQEWIWSLSMVYRLQKLCNSRCRLLPIVQNFGNPRKPCHAQSLYFDLSYHFLLCMMPALMNRSEFQVCLWHTPC